MRWNLEGGVAVITGAASGIGRALSVRLAQEKMSLAIADVDAAGLEETARLSTLGANSVSRHVLDVSDPKRMEQFARDVMGRHGRVTLLVNNAGVALFGTAEELSIEEIDWLMRINFWGVVYGVKFFLPLLRKQPRACIVNLSSAGGIVALPGNSAYCASKFAVRGFTESLRQELEGSTVAVLCILPGKVRTQISRHIRVAAGLTDRSKLGTSRDGVEHLGRTSPEAAADRIVVGVQRGEPRILIGPDAIWLDRLQRALPVRYGTVLKSLRNLRS